MNDLPKGLRILVVEDDEPVRRILTRIVRLIAAEVTTAEHGMAGLQALEEGTFDIVITDLKMPGINGLDVAAWIRTNRPSLPVLLISGFATLEDAARISALGARLLRKPFTPELLLEALREILNQRLHRQSDDV